MLSAGVIGTPQILMLSGIGSKDTLTSLGIDSVVDLPSVGQNLTDQPQILHRYLVNVTQSPDDVVRNQTLIQETLAEWNTTRQGLFVSPSGSTHGYLRLPDDSSVWSEYDDPSSGPHSAHIELIFNVSRLPICATKRNVTQTWTERFRAPWCSSTSHWSLLDHQLGRGFSSVP